MHYVEVPSNDEDSGGEDEVLNLHHGDQDRKGLPHLESRKPVKPQDDVKRVTIDTLLEYLGITLSGIGGSCTVGELQH